MLLGFKLPGPDRLRESLRQEWPKEWLGHCAEAVGRQRMSRRIGQQDHRSVVLDEIRRGLQVTVGGVVIKHRTIGIGKAQGILEPIAGRCKVTFRLQHELKGATKFTAGGDNEDVGHGASQWRRLPTLAHADGQ